MTKEEYLREQITSRGSIKDFATKINMPYTTLLSILKNVGGASINNVLKICRGLNITTNDLENLDMTLIENIAIKCTMQCSESERRLIQKYRQLTLEGKETVDTILDLQYKSACKSKKSSPKDEVG